MVFDMTSKVGSLNYKKLLPTEAEEELLLVNHALNEQRP